MGNHEILNAWQDETRFLRERLDGEIKRSVDALAALADALELLEDCPLNDHAREVCAGLRADYLRLKKR